MLITKYNVTNFFKSLHSLFSKILNSFLMFVLSLQVLKGDTCHSHSSALAEHSLSIALRKSNLGGMRCLPSKPPSSPGASPGPQ